MRKNVVYAERMQGNYRMLVFYYRGDRKVQTLFLTRFSPAVYEYFQYGKSIDQLRRKKDWVRAPTLSHLVEGRLIKRVTEIERKQYEQ